MGKEIFTHFVKQTATCQDEPDSAKKKVMIDEAWERFRAYLLIANSCPLRYRSIKKKLQQEYSLNNDQWPKTLAAAVEILSQHKFDDAWSEHKKKQSARNREQRPDNRKKHDSDQSGGAQFAQKGELVCYCCGKKGHSSPDCRHKDRIPRKDWHVNKAMKALQAAQHEAEDSDSELSDDEQSVRSSRSTSSRNRRSG